MRVCWIRQRVRQLFVWCIKGMIGQSEANNAAAAAASNRNWRGRMQVCLVLQLLFIHWISSPRPKETLSWFKIYTAGRDNFAGKENTEQSICHLRPWLADRDNCTTKRVVPVLTRMVDKQGCLSTILVCYIGIFPWAGGLSTYLIFVLFDNGRWNPFLAVPWARILLFT